MALPTLATDAGVSCLVFDQRNRPDHGGYLPRSIHIALIRRRARGILVSLHSGVLARGTPRPSSGAPAGGTGSLKMCPRDGLRMANHRARERPADRLAI